MPLNTLSLENYVSVVQNNSHIYCPDVIVRICKRKNNPKRDFLFVNSLQGKHMPISPSKVFQLYDELAGQISKSISADEKVVVIGFAETATAIGHYIASSLPECVYYMQTTREPIGNATSLLEFKEEHSHATEQFLYGDCSKLSDCDRIIFVDDEISTGNTVLNFIREIQKLGVKAKYGVASILNWQNDEWESKFNGLQIDTYFVLRGKLRNLQEKVLVTPSLEAHSSIISKAKPKIVEVKCNRTNFIKERIGDFPCSFPLFSLDVYYSISKKLGNFMPSIGENVLVLGTEEYMFAPLVFANMLEKKFDCNVKFHATTRSPIETSDYSEYAIKHRYPIISCYDRKRKTYIYNLDKYDKVYIVTDVYPNNGFISSITSHLISCNCDPSNIVIVYMKG